MINTPRPNLFESTDGFSVEILGLTGLKYREGDHALFVDSELLAGPELLGLYANSIQFWDPPHETEIITLDKREAILANIREAFRSQGFDISIV